ncbi:MAG: hypothetical protein QOE41_4727, partial [Mycobacterium sp.]|nr:hypothetical protein [Mycobacterium sp.]
SHTGVRPDIPAHDVIGDWADLSAVPGGASCWVHNGIVATAGAELIGFHGGQLVALDIDGHLRRVAETGLTEGHGITLVREAGNEYLWAADPGFAFMCDADDSDPAWMPLFGKGVRPLARAPRVVKMTLDGEICSELPLPPLHPDLPAGPMGPYCPCGVIVDEQRFGGSGDVWVADGYGSSVLHRFDKDGNHVLTLTGAKDGGRLACPHAGFIDRRNGKTPELYIADRHNTRVVVYDLEGRYLRSLGVGFLSSPSDFALWDGLLVVAELYGRLAVLDAGDNFIGYIGSAPDAPAAQSWPQRPGWPNDLDADGRATRPRLPDSHLLNSPHAVATDPDGNLYVSEWLIGGRYTKITPRRAPSTA